MADVDALRNVQVLRPRTKEQFYALQSVRLIGGKGYIMRESDLVRLRENTVVGPLLFDVTSRQTILSVLKALEDVSYTKPAGS